MNLYVIACTYLFFHLISKFGPALQTSIEAKGRGVIFDLNESPPEELEDIVDFDGITVPPEEPTITPLCSTSPRAALSVSSAELKSARKQVEPYLVAADVLVPLSHSSTSTSKRKGTEFDGGKIDTSWKKLKEQSTQKPSGNLKGQINEITQLPPNCFQTKKINPAPTGTSEVALNVASDHSSGMRSISNPSGMLDMYDWSWVIVDHHAETANDSQGDPGHLNSNPDIFKYLNGLRNMPLSGKTFWIPKGYEEAYLSKYRGDKRKKDCCYPSLNKVTKSHYNSGVLHIIIMISDQKLHLEGYMNSFSGIWHDMKSRVDTNNKTLNQVELEFNLRASYLKKMIKLTTTLSVLYLSLFGEHEGAMLTKEHIGDFLDFIKDIFNQCKKDEPPRLNSDKDFAKIWHDLLNFRCKTSKNAVKDLGIASKTVQHWLEKTGKRSRFEKHVHNKAVMEIIKKIIYFSNHKTIERFLDLQRVKYGSIK
ncbi:hypothetical protein KEM48_005341 [Puccinia striiformis f. sp. tritici PST-130]|nr:hypothetical protein Pst134EB_028502 [Puccinia striiformis f. sp. tritici]KAI9616084.1 hypothetical protein KEM48_005341 [Puccinia striiformis f. sp. tritici PST-130]